MSVVTLPRRAVTKKAVFWKQIFKNCLTCSNVHEVYYFEPGGDSAYERGGDARPNFELNP